MGWYDIPGWFDFQDIYEEAVDQAPSDAVLVEIGVGFGRSLAYLANRAMASGKSLRVYGVDPFVDDWGTAKATWGAEHAEWARAMGGPYAAFLGKMRAYAPKELEWSTVLKCQSTEAAPRFDDASLWMVFVDGSHFYEDVREDLEAWERKVIPGGIFAGHDHTDYPAFQGLKRAVAERWTDGKTKQIASSWYRRA